jgi:hypothetical protein
MAQDRDRWLLAVRAMSKSRARCKGNATFSASRRGMCTTQRLAIEAALVTNTRPLLWILIVVFSTPSQICSRVCVSHFTVREMSCGGRPGSRRRERRGPPAGRQG